MVACCLSCLDVARLWGPAWSSQGGEQQVPRLQHNLQQVLHIPVSHPGQGTGGRGHPSALGLNPSLEVTQPSPFPSQQTPKDGLAVREPRWRLKPLSHTRS